MWKYYVPTQRCFGCSTCRGHWGSQLASLLSSLQTASVGRRMRLFGSEPGTSVKYVRHYANDSVAHTGRAASTSRFPESKIGMAAPASALRFHFFIHSVFHQYLDMKVCFFEITRHLLQFLSGLDLPCCLHPVYLRDAFQNKSLYNS